MVANPKSLLRSPIHPARRRRDLPWTSRANCLCLSPAAPAPGSRVASLLPASPARSPLATLAWWAPRLAARAWEPQAPPQSPCLLPPACSPLPAPPCLLLKEPNASKPQPKTSKPKRPGPKPHELTPPQPPKDPREHSNVARIYTPARAPEIQVPGRSQARHYYYYDVPLANSLAQVLHKSAHIHESCHSVSSEPPPAAAGPR